MKLGRNKSPADHRDLPLRAVLQGHLPAPPPARSWDDCLADTPIPLFKNDLYGCCAFAAQGHLHLTWARNHGLLGTITDDDVLAAYGSATGFTVADPTTDNGADMRSALKHWRSRGIGGHKIGAYASIDPSDHVAIKAAINLFGGVYVGAALPKNVLNQLHWTYQPGLGSSVGSLGGHCVVACQYDRQFVVVKSWGRLIKVTWDWWDRYVDEVWTMIGIDWTDAKKPTPAGVDSFILHNYLDRI